MRLLALIFRRKTVLWFIFVFSLLIRFLYFPTDIYFGFDQARDAFATKEILNGDIKLVGPPTSFEGLHHGVLYYYLYAPFYLIGGGNPAFAAAFLRVLNAFGVILIFILGSILYNRLTGLIAAWLFAVSFEQTQFALYLNHPSLAVISIQVMFLGLSLLIFRKKNYGLLVALLGLGLSMQFEFILTYLVITFLVILITFRKSIPFISLRTKIISIGVFFLTLLTFIISEIKFGFRSFVALSQLLFHGSEKSFYKIISFYLFEVGQVFKFNLTGNTKIKLLVAFFLIILYLLSFRYSKRAQLVFLSFWFFSAVVVYIVTGGGDLNVDIIQYHPNVGISIALIIFISFLLSVLWKKNIFLSLIFILLISWANLSMIKEYNPKGSIPEINAQSFMLLSDEKKVLDYIYQDARGKEFAVKAITLPFYVNTTWSYLFEWYGRQKYGFLPIWNGNNALGFPGNLKVEEAQDKAPAQRYLIIEPVRGIPTHLIDNYLREESYFTNITKEVEIGKFKVQVRYKK